MWVVCEIEGKLVPITFTVSTLPRSWLIWENGELLCHWPKTSAASKIRYCAEPKSDWKTYKCRLLMKGATFETYKAALEAERIAEGFSTLSAFKDNPTTKTNDSEMEADSDVGERKKTRSASPSSTGNSSVLLSDEEFVGNDSFEYNERVKIGGTYMLETIKCSENMLDQQLDGTAKFPEKQFDLNSPRSDYSTNFAFGGMLTSTILDSEGSDGKHTMADQIHSHINKIGAMISSFVKNVEHEMKHLKQMVQVQSTAYGLKEDTMSHETQKSLKKKSETVLTSDIEILDVEILNSGYDNKALTNADLNCPIGDSLFVAPTFTAHKPSEQNIVTTINATYTLPSSVKVLSQSGYIDGELMNDGHDDGPIGHTTLVARAETPEPKIRLPIKDDEHYHQTEKLFVEESIPIDGSDTPLEKALIDHLLPLADESETLYMDRTINMVFAQQFFLDSISWKTEKKRTNISRSNVLNCWRKSFETKFGSDDYYQAFKKNFRRVKGSKRAAKRAEERKQRALNKKTMK